MIDPPQPGRLWRGFLTPRQNMEVVQNHSFRNSSIHGCRCRECKSFAQTRCVKPGVAYLQAEAEFDMHLLIGRFLRHCGLWTLSAWLLPGRIQLLGFQTPVSDKLDMPVDATIYIHSLSYYHANDLWSYVDIHTVLICVQPCNQMYILDDMLSYIHWRTFMNNLWLVMIHSEDQKHLNQYPINPWMEHFQNVFGLFELIWSTHFPNISIALYWAVKNPSRNDRKYLQRNSF